MDWVQTINKAIDYMEENILIDLTCEEIARNVYISSFHFQRAFSLLTGITVGEYMRNRRLSIAAQEMSKENVSVIDLAMKYGYETPEGFSKAFRRFHGISPAQVKKCGVNLKSFNRLVIKIILEGGGIMDYSIIEKDAFTVVAKTRVFTQQNSAALIPAFWTEYFAAGLHEKVCGRMGICLPTQEGGDNFRYGIGCGEKEVSLREMPADFEVLNIPADTWAIFKCKGPMPGAVQNMWKRIYSEWLPQANFELLTGYDIELYTDGDTKSEDYQSEIWIPVREKS